MITDSPQTVTKKTMTGCDLRAYNNEVTTTLFLSICSSDWLHWKFAVISAGGDYHIIHCLSGQSNISWYERPTGHFAHGLKHNDVSKQLI